MNDAGEVTSHLMGTFYRTIRMVEHGIKPCYVFDGKPPDMKKGVVSPSSSRSSKGRRVGGERTERQRRSSKLTMALERVSVCINS